MKVSDVARSWIGRDFRPGVPEMCMGFVRAVLTEANHPLAQVMTKAPVDGLPTGYLMASSLFGRDLHFPLTDSVAEFRPGTLLAFNDTYTGPWPANTITHIGIYLGNGEFAHRPTMSRPVEKASLTQGGYWYSKLRCGLVIDDEASPAPTKPQDPPKVPEPEDVPEILLWARPNKATIKITQVLQPGMYELYLGAYGDAVAINLGRKL